MLSNKSRNSSIRAAVTGEWSTPWSVFNELDKHFHFTLDACARPENAKCTKFYTIADDGLAQDWSGETVFCNPPSGTTNFRRWVAKAREESKKPNTTVVLLLPVSTDTEWFQEQIYRQNGVSIAFWPHRITFTSSVRPSWEAEENGKKKDKRVSPRPTMVVIMSGDVTPFRAI